MNVIVHLNISPAKEIPSCCSDVVIRRTIVAVFGIFQFCICKQGTNKLCFVIFSLEFITKIYCSKTLVISNQIISYYQPLFTHIHSYALSATQNFKNQQSISRKFLFTYKQYSLTKYRLCNLCADSLIFRTIDSPHKSP